jgi:hypothetical protein
VERGWRQLCFGVTNIETNRRPLATVLELCNETRVHIMLSEHPRETGEFISHCKI